MDSKANYLAPNLPAHLQKFILQCRQAIGDPQALPALIAAVKHSTDMPQGIAMFVLGIITHGEKALGPLNDKEIRLVIGHLVGTCVEIVESAAKSNPKSIPPQGLELIKDKKRFFQAVMAHALQLVNNASAQAAQQHAQPQGAPAAPGAPPQGGPPQGPPGPQGPQQGPPVPPDSVLAAISGNNPSKQAGSANFLENPNGS